MGKFPGWVRANRPRASGIAVIVIGWTALIPQFPDLVTTGLITIVGILLGTAVHDAVLTTEKAAAAVRVASSQAATEVASRLTKSNIGEPGQLTDVGVVAATDAAMGAADHVLESIGIDDKGHRK